LIGAQKLKNRDRVQSEIDEQIDLDPVLDLDYLHKIAIVREPFSKQH
jgi:hypothetical protein